MITGELKAQVDKLWATFWTHGISNPLTVVEQIAYLLFIRRLDDEDRAERARANAEGRPAQGLRLGPEQDHLRWSSFTRLGEPAAMLARVRDEVFPFIASLGDRADAQTYAHHLEGAHLLIGDPAVFARIVAQLERLPLDRRDTLGDIYEYMLSKLTTAGANGQFRTPRHIVEMIVEMVGPQPSTEERICDPACGTAGFLVAAAERVRPAMARDPELRAHYRATMFHGFDFDATMLRIASMNMLVHGVEDPAIRARDSLSQAAHDGAQTYTLILANPPFKGSVERSTLATELARSVKTSKTELLFLVQISRALGPGGRAAVIVPAGVLFGSSKAHRRVRQMLVEDHCVDAIVSMPPGVFRPYSGVSTALVILTKATGQSAGTEQVWFYDLRADGFSLDDRREPVEANDIPMLLASWRARDPSQPGARTEQAFFVTRAELGANDYDLSIERYKDIPYEPVAHENPRVLLDRLEDLEREIAEDIQTLRELLDERTN